MQPQYGGIVEGMTAKTFTIGIGVLAGVALFAYIGFASSITSMGYALDAKEATLTELTEEESDLIIELANVQNPTTLEEYTERLNLVELGAVSGYITTKDQNLGLNDSR